MIPGTDADRIADLEEDNRRLRRLLDQHGAPGELRHRLRSTLSLLRAIIRRSASTADDLTSYAAHLEDRLDAVTRAQAYADQYGEMNLRTMLTDELFQYGAFEGEQLILSGPEVRFLPRAGQILALAIHELASNAVEHGALDSDGGRIEVSWSVLTDAPDTLLSLSWTEHVSRPGLTPTRSGFGTEILTRMLAYEFQATTDLAFEPGGLRCRIGFPLSRQVGAIVVG